MKRYIIFLIMFMTGISYTYAESNETEPQRYVVANKKGKARFVPVEKDGDNWRWVINADGSYVPDVFLENGEKVEGFEILRNDKMKDIDSKVVYRGGFVVVHEGKYYIDPFPDKDLKPVNDKREGTSGLGIRNYLSNTFLGDFYSTKTPGLIALLCAFISGIFAILSIFKERVPVFYRWAYAIPLCVISLLEIGAAFSLGTDAAWWVNPDDVGYWIATPLLIPYAIVAAQMVFSYKIYNVVGDVEGLANVVITVLLIIGIVLTVISAIFVVINFLFAACLLVFAGWMFSGISHKNNDGSTTNTGPLGSYTTDRYGNTKHTRN